jgi:hypothetical protein
MYVSERGVEAKVGEKVDQVLYAQYHIVGAKIDNRIMFFLCGKD